MTHDTYMYYRYHICLVDNVELFGNSFPTMIPFPQLPIRKLHRAIMLSDLPKNNPVWGKAPKIRHNLPETKPWLGYSLFDVSGV